MAANDLFTFTDLAMADDMVKTNIKLNAAHPIFGGHFPGEPVLPGVCMMQMVKAVVEAHICKKVKLVLGQDLKFLSVICPGENTMIQIELKVSIDAGKIAVKAQLSNDSTVFFKFRGTFVQLA